MTSDGKHSLLTQEEANLSSYTVIPKPDQPPSRLPQEAFLDNQLYRSLQVCVPRETATQSTDFWLWAHPSQGSPPLHLLWKDARPPSEPETGRHLICTPNAECYRQMWFLSKVFVLSSCDSLIISSTNLFLKF